MKRLPSSDSGPRFQAQIRHYHRSSAPKEGSWNDWVDGGNASPNRNWIGLLTKGLIVVAILAALGALIAGFINIA